MASELFKGLNRNRWGCFIRKREPTSDTGVEVLKAQINAGTIRPWSSTTAPFSPLSSLCFSSWCCLGMLQLQLLPPSVTHPFHTQYQKRVKTSKLLFYISKSHWNQVQWFKMSCNGPSYNSSSSFKALMWLAYSDEWAYNFGENFFLLHPLTVCRKAHLTLDNSAQKNHPTFPSACWKDSFFFFTAWNCKYSYILKMVTMSLKSYFQKWYLWHYSCGWMTWSSKGEVKG